MSPLPISWSFAASGLLVGVLVGMTGVGGGALMTPLLVLLFGFSPTTAVGTDLLFASLTKTAGMAVHNFNRTVDWIVVRRLALGSVPTTAATLFILSKMNAPTGHHRHDLVSTVLGIGLLATAVSLAFRQRIVARLAPASERLGERRRYILTVGFGAILGAVISISSIGAGAVGVTVLLVLYPSFPVVRIVGCDIAHAVPLTLVAGLGHSLIGTTDWHALASLLVGSIPGIVISSYFAKRIPDAVLSPVLAVTLAVAGIQIVI